MSRKYTTRDVMERFWSKVDKDGPIPDAPLFPELKTPCWAWLCTINEKGYAKFFANRKVYRAHKFIYELIVGAVPKGLVLDHKCRTRHCVNPYHLDPVTPKVNTERGVVAQVIGQRGRDMTHCRKGHEFTIENTHHILFKGGGTGRRCRICAKLNMRKTRLRKKGFTNV